ncbi:MAG: hypothetical protein MRZ79_17410 [Bacteroidia bacterium]|nr:hypothetical protein [Bacteroidia bacterium]
MENSLSPYDRLDSYLEKLEAQEKVKRQRLFLILAIVFAVVASGGFFAYTSYFSEPEIAEENEIRLRRYAAEELNPELVQKLFVKDPNSIVVIHPVTGVDTIESMDDYYQFLNRLTMLEMDTEVEPASTELKEEVTLPEEDPEFLVKVEGEKKVGAKLIYTIENFDPSFELLLDFGNGIIRKPSSPRYTYKYPLPGHFDFHLKLVKDGEEEIIQTIKYQIFPKEEQQADQGATLVQETSTS